MILRITLILFSIYFISCSKKDPIYKIKPKADSYKTYNVAYEAFEKGDYFFAQKKFLEAELNMEKVEYSAKASIMASYSLYSINFYDEALENIERYLKLYPSDVNVIYAHYLTALIFFEQITDEKKDMQPLIKSRDKINFFLKEFPNTEYAIDLKFKKDLIINQMAAKELFIAKYYISVQKWIPAINRLKIILQDYDKTIFIEEALHRLVEINYFIGLESEAKKYASILGYNYNSSEWYQQSYKVLNRDYKILKDKKEKKNSSFIKRIIKKIR
jgi:outer membrane protein assembly factor BamD